MGDLRFAVVGYGRMGRLVEKELGERGENIVGVIDPPKGKEWFDLSNVDSAICFTSPDAGYNSVRKLLENGVDVIIGTTRFYLNGDGGVNKRMIEEFDSLAKENNARAIYASNFSIGVNAFWRELKNLSKTMSDLGYDPAIVEEHHSEKADISGTAKTIGQILIKNGYGNRSLNFGDLERKRRDDEITVSSVRAGKIPGTHKVIFESPDGEDSIELNHTAKDPNIFVKGAIKSAYWLRDQKPGVFSIEDMLS